MATPTGTVYMAQPLHFSLLPVHGFEMHGFLPGLDEQITFFHGLFSYSFFLVIFYKYPSVESTC